MLRMIHLKKRFGENLAVDDLTLEIRRGEVFGLLGPNGAGKTTTVNMAVGLLEPDEGQVELTGLGPPGNPQVRKKIGVAPQALSIYEKLSGRENLLFFGKIEGLHGKELSRKVDRALDFVELTDRQKDLAKTYSGGMKRRLNLAIALVHNPPLLLLDEPTVGVDPQSRNSIFDKIDALKQEGRTIVYTTHYMEEAQRLCDRVGIIDHGKLLALDTVENLIKKYGGNSIVIAEMPEGEVRIETTDPMAELTKLQATGKLLRFR
ncbi:MAG TPA: ABC transporter ATP-binding protein, partial [Caldithrix sp.]|nr:ABC transporter ATP-binding protein [Caldithrix sp.]